MTLMEERPHFRVFCRDRTSYLLRLDERESFTRAWHSGAPFWQGTDVWGQALDIKLADIVGTCVKTEASLALIAEEDAEGDRRKLLKGGDE